MTDPVNHCSHLESPESGSTLAPGMHNLRGWIFPTNGNHYVDVRAHIGNRIFPGVHGFPRADLATHFKTQQPFALAEFCIAIDLDAGPVEIVLEALNIEGCWTAFKNVHYTVDPRLERVTFAVPSGPIRWHEYGRALQSLLRLKRMEARATLDHIAQELVEQIPYPRDLLHAPLPFHGHLDEPAALTRCGFGRTAVLGYLFHETQSIKRVLATYDLQAWQTVDHLQASPDAAEYYPAFETASHCGIFGIIDIPAQLPNPVSLRLYAELDDGSLHLCSVQRSHLFTNEDEKMAYPAKDSIAFADVRSSLDKAFAVRKIAIIREAEFNRDLLRIETDFNLRAPETLTAINALQGAPTTSQSPQPQEVLLVTHNLNFEGAPLFLVDYAEHLASLGSRLTILTPEDGPLRSRFEKLGAQIHILDVNKLFAAQSAAEAQAELASLCSSFDISRYDLVVANTFTTFWAIHAAKAALRRVLLYVHESSTPASFYIGRVHPEVIALVDTAFGLADCVSFTTASTRNYHLDYGCPENHRLTPGWVEVGRIDDWMAEKSREALRGKFQLKPDEFLVTNVGTVCDRNGQHIFARAIDLLWRRYPKLAQSARFIMLGGGKTPFDVVLSDLLKQINRSNITVHPANADYLPYYAAADLFVCSTYEESSPRVILEAMACETPIISSAVHGVPEQARADSEATLVPPGDTVALCEAMAKLLQSPELRLTLAKNARERVVSEFDSKILLPHHAALACEVAAGNI